MASSPWTVLWLNVGNKVITRWHITPQHPSEWFTPERLLPHKPDIMMAGKSTIEDHNKVSSTFYNFLLNAVYPSVWSPPISILRNDKKKRYPYAAQILGGKNRIVDCRVQRSSKCLASGLLTWLLEIKFKKGAGLCQVGAFINHTTTAQYGREINDTAYFLLKRVSLKLRPSISYMEVTFQLEDSRNKQSIRLED